MKADRKDTFKKIIKNAQDEAPSGFTDSVMLAVEAELARERSLKTLLQQQPADSLAYIDFTAGVMAQLEAQGKSSSAYQPIISKKAWYGIAACVAFFLVVIGLSNPSSSGADSKSAVSGFLQNLYAVPPLYLMVFIIAGILLLADYLITQRNNKTDLV